MRFILLFALWLAGSAYGEVLSGRVVGISDGDTIRVLLGSNQQMRVRAADIDAPERRAPWGAKAKQAMAELVFRRVVDIEVVDTDRYGRKVGTIFVDGLNVNEELVESGNAWVYTKYLRNRNLISVEQDARRNKRGLWSLPEREQVPPWIWRRNQ